MKDSWVLKNVTHSVELAGESHGWSRSKW